MAAMILDISRAAITKLRASILMWRQQWRYVLVVAC